MIKFYLTMHMPHILATSPVPLCVSHRRLAGRRTLPKARVGWMLDSGGFSELSLFGGWQTSPQDYVAAVRRYDREIGKLEWAAPQDWMCEPDMLALTGLTVLEHQRRTVENFKLLQRLWYAETDDESPFMPPLQGDVEGEHVRCAEMYLDAGIDVRDYEIVGLGSVCRRSRTDEIGAIVAEVRAAIDPKLPLHGFGVKTLGLRKYGDQLTTADSMAWSEDARKAALKGRGKLCGTEHPRDAKACTNCVPYAMQWRERVLDLPSTHYRQYETTYLPWWEEAA